MSLIWMLSANKKQEENFDLLYLIFKNLHEMQINNICKQTSAVLFQC